MKKNRVWKGGGEKDKKKTCWRVVFVLSRRFSEKTTIQVGSVHEKKGGPRREKVPASGGPYFLQGGVAEEDTRGKGRVGKLEVVSGEHPFPKTPKMPVPG